MNSKIREKGIIKTTVIGSIINSLLIVFKFVSGILGSSAAMIADAIHSLSDLITDIIVIVFVKISGKPKDKNHNYGHGKFETLATSVIGIILVFVGLGIAYNGLKAIFSVINGAVLPTPGMIAFWAALLSIVAKEGIYRYTIWMGKKLNSDVVIANAWHHRSDALSSLGAALGIGGAIFLGDKWTILDPIAAVVVSIFIIKVAIQLLKSAVDELMECSLPEEIENEIKSIVNSFDDITNLHNLHTRKIGSNYAMEFHIWMDGDKKLDEIHIVVNLIENKLRERYGLQTHIMIHIEPNKYMNY